VPRPSRNVVYELDAGGSGTIRRAGVESEYIVICGPATQWSWDELDRVLPSCWDELPMLVGFVEEAVE
jgi:hypothetical protein